MLVGCFGGCWVGIGVAVLWVLGGCCVGVVWVFRGCSVGVVWVCVGVAGCSVFVSA